MINAVYTVVNSYDLMKKINVIDTFNLNSSIYLSIYLHNFNQQLRVFFFRCVGHAEMPINCYEETNPHAPFPQCCPRQVCKGDAGFNQTKSQLFGK